LLSGINVCTRMLYDYVCLHVCSYNNNTFYLKLACQSYAIGEKKNYKLLICFPNSSRRVTQFTHAKLPAIPSRT